MAPSNLRDEYLCCPLRMASRILVASILHQHRQDTARCVAALDALRLALHKCDRDALDAIVARLEKTLDMLDDVMCSTFKEQHQSA
jgi:hypothetical protein